MNQALLMMQAWKLHSNQTSLLFRVLLFNSLVSVTPYDSSLKGPRLIYWGRRGLRQAQANLLMNCSWKIGNGESTKAFRDRWVADAVRSLVLISL